MPVAARILSSFASALSFAAVARFNFAVAIAHLEPVTSLAAPELALYSTLRRVEEHERQGVLVAANHKVIRRLLASRFTVLSALLTPAWLEKLEPELRARPEAIKVFIADREVTINPCVGKVISRPRSGFRFRN